MFSPNRKTATVGSFCRCILGHALHKCGIGNDVIPSPRTISYIYSLCSHRSQARMLPEPVKIAQDKPYSNHRNAPTPWQRAFCPRCQRPGKLANNPLVRFFALHQPFTNMMLYFIREDKRVYLLAICMPFLAIGFAFRSCH